MPLPINQFMQSLGYTPRVSISEALIHKFLTDETFTPEEKAMILNMSPQQISYLYERKKNTMKCPLVHDGINENHRMYGANTEVTFYDDIHIAEFKTPSKKGNQPMAQYEYQFGRWKLNPYNVKMYEDNFYTLHTKRAINDENKKILTDPLYWIRRRPYEHLLARLAIRKMQYTGSFRYLDAELINHTVYNLSMLYMDFNDGDIMGAYTLKKCQMSSLYGIMKKDYDKDYDLESQIRKSVTMDHHMYILMYRIKMM